MQTPLVNECLESTYSQGFALQFKWINWFLKTVLKWIYLLLMADKGEKKLKKKPIENKISVQKVFA